MHIEATTIALAFVLVACGDDDGPPAPPSEPRACDGTDHDGNGVVDDMEPPCVPCRNDRLTFDGENPQRSAIVRLGDAFAVAFEAGGDHVAMPKIALLEEARGDAGIARLEPVAVSDAATMITKPTLVLAGDALVVAWEDVRAAAPGIYARSFSRELEPLTPEVLVAAGGTAPRLSYAGSAGLGLVYVRVDEGVPHVAFTTLSSDLVATTPIMIDRTGAGAVDAAIAAASGGFGIVFSDLDEEGEIYFARIEQGALVDDAQRLTIEAGRSEAPDIAWSGAEYGLVWIDARTRNSGDVLFVRLDRDGLPVGDVEMLTDVEGGVYLPTVAASSNAFFVAWNDLRDGHDAIYATELFAEMPARIHDISGETVASGYPSATYDGHGFALTWYDGRTGSNELYFARFGASAYCD